MKETLTTRWMLPLLDGAILANALHYAPRPEHVLRNIIHVLDIAAPLIIIEYDTDEARPPWIPHPVSRSKLEALCSKVGLSQPELIGSVESVYGSNEIYSVVTRKDNTRLGKDRRGRG